MRDDGGIYEGAEVSIYYDPMISKLAVYGKTREEAIDRLRRALQEYEVGGILIVAFERWYREGEGATGDIRAMSYRNALIVGLFQSIAMSPGVSRSAATILGGLLLGLKRKTIVEFTFLLAVPTMLAATGYDLIKSGSQFSLDQVQYLLIGFVTAFVVALLSIKFLLRFIKTHTFIPFGIYRIVLVIVWVLLLK